MRGQGSKKFEKGSKIEMKVKLFDFVIEDQI